MPPRRYRRHSNGQPAQVREYRQVVLAQPGQVSEGIPDAHADMPADTHIFRPGRQRRAVPAISRRHACSKCQALSVTIHVDHPGPAAFVREAGRRNA